jgi:hypothetical protein
MLGAACMITAVCAAHAECVCAGTAAAQPLHAVGTHNLIAHHVHAARGTHLAPLAETRCLARQRVARAAASCIQQLVHQSGDSSTHHREHESAMHPAQHLITSSTNLPLTSIPARWTGHQPQHWCCILSQNLHLHLEQRQVCFFCLQL